MALEPPSDETISMVVEVTGVDREAAANFLKVKQNDAERAISAILDGENIDDQLTSVAWDESAWTSDRDGPQQGPQLQSFLDSSAAPTRGSSPVPSLRQPNTQAEADDEMEKALAMSRQAFGPQESGVVDLQGRTITANRDDAQQNHYDPNQWSMTLTNQPARSTQSVTEMFPEVDIKQRRHHDQVPRFLRPLSAADYLPNLLTIGHSIPLLRDLWLSPSSTVSEYGHNPEWWRGAEINVPKVINMDNGSQAGSGQPDDILLEYQRLMAFMDLSKRLYASPQALATIVRATDPASRPTLDTLIDQTLSSWEASAIRQANLDQRSADSLLALHSVVASNHPDGVRTPDFWTLPLTVVIENDADGASVSLGETVDRALWNAEALENSADDFHDTYLERCADVLVMRVSQANAGRSSLGLIIPTEFHVDRYLKENIESTRTLRREMATLRARISKSEQIIARLETFRHPDTPQVIDASDIFEHVLRHYNGKNRIAILEERESRGVEVDLPEIPPEYAAISEKLQGLCGDIEAKLAALRGGIDQARASLRQLSERSPGDQTQPSKHIYSLRGVATKPSVTYVLRPKTGAGTQETSSHIDDVDEDAPPGMQWWRIEFDVPLYGPPKVLTTPSTTDDVLRAVELEHTAALLVYASEQACSHVSIPTLPDALQEFVRRDDQAFENEMEVGETVQETSAAYSDWPTQFNTVPRRGSADSTIVNYDDGLPPSYDSISHRSDHPLVVVNDEKSTRLGHHVISNDATAVGLVDGAESPPVHEIRLDDAEDNDSMRRINSSPNADLVAHSNAGVESAENVPSSDIVMGDSETGTEGEAAAKRKRESGP